MPHRLEIFLIRSIPKNTNLQQLTRIKKENLLAAKHSRASGSLQYTNLYGDLKDGKCIGVMLGLPQRVSRRLAFVTCAPQQYLFPLSHSNIEELSKVKQYSLFAAILQSCEDSCAAFQNLLAIFKDERADSPDTCLLSFLKVFYSSCKYSKLCEEKVLDQVEACGKAYRAALKPPTRIGTKILEWDVEKVRIQVGATFIESFRVMLPALKRLIGSHLFGMNDEQKADFYSWCGKVMISTKEAIIAKFLLQEDYFLHALDQVLVFHSIMTSTFTLFFRDGIKSIELPYYLAEAGYPKVILDASTILVVYVSKKPKASSRGVSIVAIDMLKEATTQPVAELPDIYLGSLTIQRMTEDLSRLLISYGTPNKVHVSVLTMQTTQSSKSYRALKLAEFRSELEDFAAVKTSICFFNNSESYSILLNFSVEGEKLVDLVTVLFSQDLASDEAQVHAPRIVFRVDQKISAEQTHPKMLRRGNGYRLIWWLRQKLRVANSDMSMFLQRIQHSQKLPFRTVDWAKTGNSQRIKGMDDHETYFEILNEGEHFDIVYRLPHFKVKVPKIQSG